MQPPPRPSGPAPDTSRASEGASGGPVRRHPRLPQGVHAMDPGWRERWARNRMQDSYVRLPPSTGPAQRGPGSRPESPVGPASASRRVPPWAVVVAACMLTPALWLAFGP